MAPYKLVSINKASEIKKVVNIIFSCGISDELYGSMFVFQLFFQLLQLFKRILL